MSLKTFNCIHIGILKTIRLDDIGIMALNCYYILHIIQYIRAVESFKMQHITKTRPKVSSN